MRGGAGQKGTTSSWELREQMARGADITEVRTEGRNK
jgi:hypothetical protein